MMFPCSFAICAAISVSAAIGIGNVVSSLFISLVQLTENSVLLNWTIPGKNDENLDPPLYFGVFAAAFSVTFVACFTWIRSLYTTIAEIEKQLKLGYNLDDYDLILEILENGDRVLQYHLRVVVVDVVEPGQSRQIKGTIWSRLKNLHRYLIEFLDNFRNVQFNPLGVVKRQPKRTKRIPSRKVSDSESCSSTLTGHSDDVFEKPTGSRSKPTSSVDDSTNKEEMDVSEQSPLLPRGRQPFPERSERRQTKILPPLTPSRRSDRLRTRSEQDIPRKIEKF